MDRARIVGATLVGLAVLATSACTTRVGTLGGWESTAADINTAGTVVGSSTTADGIWAAYVRPPGGALRQLAIAPGVAPASWPIPANAAEAVAVNDAGTVVGNVELRMPRQEAASQAFRWTDPAGMVAVPGLEHAADINGDGTVIGWAGVSTGGPLPQAARAAVVFVAGSPKATALPVLDGQPLAAGEAFSVNKAGTIAGCTTDAGGTLRAVTWTGPSHTVTVLAPAAAGASCATGINDQGVIVGYRIRPSDGVRIGSVWDRASGPRTDLGDNVFPHAINSNGVVVGERLEGLTWRAFRWSRTQPTFVDLGPSSAAPAGTSTYATAINDAGTVAGWEQTPDGHLAAITVT